MSGRSERYMKKSNTKDKIIDKATDLFYKNGFVKASIRDIVRAVGVTNSTFYSHYKNKDEMREKHDGNDVQKNSLES